jgi:hypothetical protein
MEKIMISFAKGRGKNILATPNSKNANRMPHHHLNIFIMGISLFNPSRYG